MARLALYRDGEPLVVMVPEKRQYWLEEQPASIPSIYSTISVQELSYNSSSLSQSTDLPATTLSATSRGVIP